MDCCCPARKCPNHCCFHFHCCKVPIHPRHFCYFDYCCCCCCPLLPRIDNTLPRGDCSADSPRGVAPNNSDRNWRGSVECGSFPGGERRPVQCPPCRRECRSGCAIHGRVPRILSAEYSKCVADSVSSDSKFRRVRCQYCQWSSTIVHLPRGGGSVDSPASPGWHFVTEFQCLKYPHPETRPEYPVFVHGVSYSDPSPCDSGH